ncbi:hypothetical protein KIN20_018320 [Parelaphostrongylus tenuis]|uniref:Uncharacterized protein n=1 Tax=Parelaphostrongylus tenuis TaxID=148309 RepID=A0AAD5N0Y0_PARTN|nr:hypothetical protein KIN20_018320 [Parelaphostrongylus tenuis]
MYYVTSDEVKKFKTNAWRIPQGLINAKSFIVYPFSQNCFHQTTFSSPTSETDFLGNQLKHEMHKSYNGAYSSAMSLFRSITGFSLVEQCHLAKVSDRGVF